MDKLHIIIDIYDYQSAIDINNKSAKSRHLHIKFLLIPIILKYWKICNINIQIFHIVLYSFLWITRINIDITRTHRSTPTTIQCAMCDDVSFAQFTSVIDIFVCYRRLHLPRRPTKITNYIAIHYLTLLCGTNISLDRAYFDNPSEKGHRITGSAYSKRIITFCRNLAGDALEITIISPVRSANSYPNSWTFPSDAYYFPTDVNESGNYSNSLYFDVYAFSFRK